jgi:hypothetical protein
MGFLGFGRKKESNLVVVMYEGPGLLRLNGNRKTGKEAESAKKNAAAHDRTVCWIEFSQGGMRLDQGTGPAAAKLGAGAAEKLLRELPLNTACKNMLNELERGQDRSAKILSWEDRNQTAKPR